MCRIAGSHRKRRKAVHAIVFLTAVLAVAYRPAGRLRPELTLRLLHVSPPEEPTAGRNRTGSGGAGACSGTCITSPRS